MLQYFMDISSSIIIRSFGAFILSFLIYICFGTQFINFLHKHQKFGQPIRDDGPKTHLQKKGTPTMGGVLLLISSVISVLIFADLHNVFIWCSLLVIIMYGLSGFIDDYEKVTRNSSKAMSAKMKLLLQFSGALVVVLLVSYATNNQVRYVVNFPYLQSFGLNIGLFYIPFAMIVIAGASNGVNLSDGLDGLAAGLLVLSFTCFAVIAYFIGIPHDYVYSLYIEDSEEMCVLCASIVGACLGFLWFNAPKAQVFMGDTGALALGALLGSVAVILKQEILLAIVGGVFVCETISVFLQVAVYKKTGKRIFKMAPIHHHFEQCGWPEVTVVVRFWIIGIILAVLGLMSLVVAL